MTTDVIINQITQETIITESYTADPLVIITEGVQGPPGIQGPPGLPGPANTEVEEATLNPLGIENRGESVIYFTEGDRTFHIAPVSTSYNYWIAGTKTTVSEARSIQIPAVTGLYHIYYDTDDVLKYKTEYFAWDTEVHIAYVYWNAELNQLVFFAEERHGVSMDWATHEYLHRTRGAAFASGFNVHSYTLTGDGSQDSDAQLAITGGTFFDEDIEIIVTHSATPSANSWEQELELPARIPILRQEGAGWIREATTNFPLLIQTLGENPYYSTYTGSSWGKTQVLDSEFTAVWLVATNNLNSPIIAIPAQKRLQTLSALEEYSFSELALDGFPVYEFRPLYRLGFEVRSEYANSVNARLVSVTDIRGVQAVIPGAVPTNDHGLMSGLADDDHDQYLHLETVRTVTAAHNFPITTKFGGKTVIENARESISGEGIIQYSSSTGLISAVETDPVFIASASYGITSTQVSNWDTAYSWGNHATAGYAITTNPNVTFSGTITHSGLVPTSGTNIDQVKTITTTVTITTNWQDTGIVGSDLATGTYFVQLFANDSPDGGSNTNEYYSGIMSWYSDILTSDVIELPNDEITLHRAGAGSQAGMYLRTYRVQGSYMKLQMYSNQENASPSNYVLKFRRVI